MRISAFCAAVLTYVLTGHPPPAVAQVDQQRAQEWFKEVQAVCEREGLRLWGMSLCGPMVIADLRTQTIATSQPAPEGPPPRGILNAPIEWGGVTWAAVGHPRQRAAAGPQGDPPPLAIPRHRPAEARAGCLGAVE
jgi:hypothetical protein